MKGAGSNASIGQKAVQAILAGNDLIMVGWSYREQKEAVESVIKAVSTGRIQKKRIEQSLYRILSYKRKFYRKPSNKKSIKEQMSQIPLKKIYNKVFHEIFKKQTENISIKGKKVDVYSHSPGFLMNYKRLKGSRLFYLKNFQGWKKNPDKDFNIIYHLSGPLTKRILKTAPYKIRKKIIVINSSGHLNIENESDYNKVIHIHSHHPKLGSFTAHYLSGKSLNTQKPTSKN